MAKKRRSLKALLGSEGLSGDFYKFLVVHILFLVFTRLPGIFINTMMMAEGSEVDVVLLYNGAFFATGAVCMVLAAKVVRRIGSGLAAVLGIVLYVATYLVILLLGRCAADYNILIGVLNGLADGFYWISYGQLLSGTTRPENRDRAIAILSLLGAVVGLVVPLLGSVLIQLVGGITGYLLVFGLAFLVALATCFYALRLRGVHGADEKGRSSYKNALAAVRKSRAVRMALLGQGCKGIREGAFTFILSVVLYQLVRSEILIGVNTFLAGAASIVAYRIMSETLGPNNRMRWMKYAVVVLCAAALGSLAWVAPVAVLLYSVVNAYFSGYLENTCYSVFIDAFMADPAARANRPEMLAVNDVFLVAGRCIGLLVILLVQRFLGAGVRWQLFSLFLLSASQFLTVHFCAAATRAHPARMESAAGTEKGTRSDDGSEPRQVV